MIDAVTRAEALGAARAARLAEALAERVREVPGVSAEVAGGDVVISGRGLWRRPELRWIGGLLR